MTEVKNRVCLVVIDGWGISNESKGWSVFFFFFFLLVSFAL